MAQVIVELKVSGSGSLANLLTFADALCHCRRLVYSGRLFQVTQQRLSW